MPFRREVLLAQAEAHRPAFEAARPFRHAVIDGVLGAAESERLARAFPLPTHPGFRGRAYREQSGRYGQLQRTDFAGVDAGLRGLLDAMNGSVFLDFLQALTGLEGLIPDPHFTGAGLHVTEPGGHLALHVDFNRDRRRHLARRLTALYYLPTAEWNASWGGALELWNAAATQCEQRILPVRDRLVVFAHGESHWHGHPSPLASPRGVHRNVVATIYYTASELDEGDAHGAIWRGVEPAPRP